MVSDEIIIRFSLDDRDKMFIIVSAAIREENFFTIIKREKNMRENIA
jgi:hypothetical protein